MAHIHTMCLPKFSFSYYYLLVNVRGQVKPADFGTSHGGDDQTAATTCRGTCAYMSPERMDPERCGGDGSGRAETKAGLGDVDVSRLLWGEYGESGEDRFAGVSEFLPEVFGEGLEEKRDGGGASSSPFSA
ncbi:hypothetical protein C2S51_037227 [Perilla frutescens var. frutescens]|nr:hypothetical protein C2S51_037227 [Perilla frutescens var. frutescens]